MQGGVGTIGHWNRKNEQASFHDVTRLFAINNEKRKITEKTSKHGEIYQRSHRKDEANMNATREKIKEFIPKLLNGTFDVNMVQGTPILELFEACNDTTKRYIVDYTRHYTSNQYSEQIKESFSEILPKNCIKCLYYKPIARNLLLKQIRDSTEVDRILGHSGLDDNEADYEEYESLLKFSAYYKEEFKGKNMIHVPTNNYITILYCILIITIDTKKAKSKRKREPQGKSAAKSKIIVSEDEESDGNEDDVKEYELIQTGERATSGYNLRETTRISMKLG